MTYLLLSTDLVVTFHDAVLNPGELNGLAMNKALDEALGRVENPIAYGMTGDVFDLAAACAVAIAQGHCFNDANKRTAFRAMNAVLALNGVQVRWTAEQIGSVILRASQRLLDEGELAEWLR